MTRQLPINNLPLPRRRFLQLLVAFNAVVPASVLLAVPVKKPTRQTSIQALGPYLDTLIPEDLTPSATQLGMDVSLIAVARANSKFARLIALGCEWLDKQGRERGVEDFAALDESAKEAVVAAAENSEENSLQRVFFTSTHRILFQYYYAHPDSWSSLGYVGPPQPLGFLDYAQPPKEPTQ